MTDPEPTAPDSAAYDGCPCLAYLPWWRAGMVYAERAEEDDADCDVDALNSEMSLYHFLLFWGMADGRL